MNILQLTPGTGNFYCGNCVRDNSLAIALREQGHNCHLAPMYLPMMTDGPSAASDPEIHFGGINAYLQQKSFLFRVAPRWLDRVFDSKWMLRFAAKKAGMTKASELGAMTVSMLRGEQGNQGKEIDKLIEWIHAFGNVDVVNLSNCLLIGLARRIRDRLGIPVVCTLMGEDAFLDSLTEPHRETAWKVLAERAEEVDGFVAVSQYYADVMKKRMQLRDDQLHVVHNGISLEGYERDEAWLRSAGGEPPIQTLGFFARLCHGKGLHTVVDAFILLKKQPAFRQLKLRIAGTKTDADDAYIQAQRDKLTAADVMGDVEILTNVTREQKIQFLQSLSVLSVPTNYGESFGMYVLEALAAGVPVVQPNEGAFPELIRKTGGGVLYEPNKPQALAQSLERLLPDHERLRELGNAGRRAVESSLTVKHMATGIIDVYEQVLTRHKLSRPSNQPEGLNDTATTATVTEAESTLAADEWAGQ